VITWQIKKKVKRRNKNYSNQIKMVGLQLLGKAGPRENNIGRRKKES